MVSWARSTLCVTKCFNKEIYGCIRSVLRAQSLEMTRNALLTKDEIADLLNLTRRGVECLVAQRKIPVIRISHRCVRFDWEKVCAALGRFEIKEVGR